MKYIKPFKLFKEDFETDKTDTTTIELAKKRLNDYNLKLKDYLSKKAQIDSTIKNNTKHEDISVKLKKIVGVNDFLIKYLEIANLNDHINQTEEQIKGKQKDITDKKQEITDTSTIEDAADKSKQISDLNTDIVGYNKDILSLNQKILDLKRQILDKQKGLDKFIKDTKTKIDMDIKTLSVGES
jgi:hypothetical protein